MSFTPEQYIKSSDETVLAAGPPPAQTASIMDAIMEFRRLSGFLLAGLTGATIGYFAGREHLKYEMRSAIQSAAEQVKHELSSALGKPASTAQPRPVEAPAPTPTKEPTPVSVSLLKKGFHEKNIMANDYQDAITFIVSFSNLTGKDIGRLTVSWPSLICLTIKSSTRKSKSTNRSLPVPL